MFESLSDRLSSAFRSLSGRAQLTEENIRDGLREVRLALLEADVNFKVVKEFVERVRERVLGIKTPYKTIEGVAAAKRPPALCPGCPHRGFFYTLSKNKSYVVTGDIGCYTLGSAAPLNCMDVCICMGGGFTAGVGMARSFQRENVTEISIP